MKLTTYSRIKFSFVLIIVVATCVIFWLYNEKSNDMLNLANQRYHGYEFGQKLKYDSAQLTRLARSYVASGQRRFYDDYHRLFNIQLGKQARTMEGLNSLFIIEQQPHVELVGKKITTIELIKLQNISSDEQLQLTQAIKISNALGDIELEAFRIFDHHRDDNNAALNEEQVKALTMLFDDTYVGFQQAIKRHIDLYVVMQNARLSREYQAEQLILKCYLWSLIAIFFTLLIIVFLTEYFFKKNLSKPLTLLTRGSKNAKQHNYKQKVNAQSSIEEVNQLTDHFNNMFDDINQKIIELSEQVEKSSQLRTKAEIANQSKSTFLANMSHEIRTPLNGMVGLQHLLKGTELNQEQLDYTNKSIESAGSLLKIINDVLDFSKIEAGAFTLDSQNTTIESILEHVINLTAVSANEKGIEYLLNIDSRVPVEINIDRTRVLQVLLNIISNAIKFTDKGFVALDISIDNSTEKTLLKFSVKDSGIGMTQPQLAHIFKPFKQADNSTTRKFGGTGLGLTISKNIAIMLGGDIQVDSQSGLGTEFIFTVECKQTNSARTQDIKISRPTNVHSCFGSRSKQFAISQLLTQVGADNKEIELSQLLVKSVSDKANFLIIDDDILGQISPVQVQLIKDNYQKVIKFPSYRKNTINSSLTNNLVDRNALWPILPSKLIRYLNLNSYNLSASQTDKKHDWKQHQLNDLKFLLAEDIKLNQIVVKKMINKLNGQVDIANSGIDVMALLSKNHYDVILMDLHMPYMDGYEATKRIRKHPQWSSIPIIGFSADAQDSSKITCLEIGMNDYIIKPFEPIELVNKVQKLTENNKRLYCGESKS